jgi:hypothetical protein
MTLDLDVGWPPLPLHGDATTATSNLESPRQRFNAQSFVELPCFLSYHSETTVTMATRKVMRDAGLLHLSNDGPAQYAERIRKQLKKVVSPRGLAVQFGSICLNQADLANVGGCSDGFVSAFFNDSRTPDFSMGSLASCLGEYGMRILYTPTDPHAGLSPEILAMLPDPALVAAKKKAKAGARAVCGGRCIGAAAKPIKVKARSFQGSSDVKKKQQ